MSDTQLDRQIKDRFRAMLPEYSDPSDMITGYITPVTGLRAADPLIFLTGTGLIWLYTEDQRVSVPAVIGEGMRNYTRAAGVRCKTGLNGKGDRVAREPVDDNQNAALNAQYHNASQQAVYVNSQQFTPGLVTAYSPETGGDYGLFVYVHPFTYGGVVVKGKVAVSALVPATTNERGIAVVYYDISDAALGAVAGTTSLMPSTSFALDDAAAIALGDTDRIRLGAVILEHGQTTIVETDTFFDCRDFLTLDGAGGSAGTATTTTLGIALIDQDPPSGSPVALTLAERNTAQGVVQFDTDTMLSSMALPESGARGIVSEASAWVVYAGNPLWGGSGASASQEPSVMIEDGVFKMWYTSQAGGGHNPRINYATSSDGITWTQYGGNPVLGEGGSGYAGRAEHSSVVKFDGVYYIYFATDNGSEINRSTSTDGITWTTPVQVIAQTQEAWSNGWDNTYVWREGYVWYMLLDGVRPSDTTFQTALATSLDGLVWTFNAAEWLTSLDLVGGGSSGGMFMMTPQKRDGFYHQWYQPSSVAGVTPTAIYRATSPDLITWTILSGPVIPLPGGSYDQVADPAIVEWQGKTYMYFEQVINASSTFEMCLAIYDGTMAQLLDGVVPSGALATSSTVGVVKPDNVTLQVDGSGVMSVIPAAFPVYAPLVTGDTPGPTPIATPDGQYIMIRIA